VSARASSTASTSPLLRADRRPARVQLIKGSRPRGSKKGQTDRGPLPRPGLRTATSRSTDNFGGHRHRGSHRRSSIGDRARSSRAGQGLEGRSPSGLPGGPRDPRRARGYGPRAAPTAGFQKDATWCHDRQSLRRVASRPGHRIGEVPPRDA
jgi:hypothetical protein